MFGVNVYCPVLAFNVIVPVVATGWVTVNVGEFIAFAPVSFVAKLPVLTVFCGVEIGSVTATGVTPLVVNVIVVLEHKPVLLHNVYVVVALPTKLGFGTKV